VVLKFHHAVFVIVQEVVGTYGKHFYYTLHDNNGGAIGGLFSSKYQEYAYGLALRHN
jgi:hypothetical protein